ncbi:hypothetical protein [Virgibacillus halodenitrificans]|uniref:hypothetical protein n=1 Tax=Virgibacillus halodenitrificans TaxID=1482 RepID=UPI000EF51B74|nr:hypothetical protein [Virgibacillus halodenitrificans]
MPKEFAKIGKSIFRQLSSYIEIYSSIENEQQKAEEETELDRVIKETASQLSFGNEIVMKNGEPTYSISVNKHRLSKTQILQFILYHFYHVDERGVIRNVQEKDIAEAIGCTLKTVRNNNVIFEQLDLIYHSRSSNGINIKLVDYPHYFDKNGYGYIELSFERLEELIKIENVNALRLEIRKELVYDNNEAKRKYKHDYSPSKISFHDFKTFAPKYTHYRGMLEEISKKGTNTYKTIINDDNSLYFILDEGMQSSKELKEVKKEEYTKAIAEYLDQHKVSGYVSQLDRSDFVQLAFEYSLNRVFQALDVLINEEFVLGLQVTRNFGGRLRTIIRQQLEDTVLLIS